MTLRGSPAPPIAADRSGAGPHAAAPLFRYARCSVPLRSAAMAPPSRRRPHHRRQAMWRPSPPSITDDYDPCVRQTVVALHIDPDLASYVCRLQGRRTANGSEIRVSTCPSGPNGVRPRPTRKQGVRPTSAVTTPARLSSLFAGAKLRRERPGTIALTPPQPALPSTPPSALPDASAT